MSVNKLAKLGESTGEFVVNIFLSNSDVIFCIALDIHLLRLFLSLVLSVLHQVQGCSGDNSLYINVIALSFFHFHMYQDLMRGNEAMI